MIRSKLIGITLGTKCIPKIRKGVSTLFKGQSTNKFQHAYNRFCQLSKTPCPQPQFLTVIIILDGIPSKTKWKYIPVFSFLFSLFLYVILYSTHQVIIVLHQFSRLFRTPFNTTWNSIFSWMFLLLTDLLIPSHPHLHPFNGQNLLNVT